MFARMSPSKDTHASNRAIAKSNSNIHAIFCGGPLKSAYSEKLYEEVKQLNLVDRVHFQGVQTNLGPYYAACNLIGNFLAQPEGFGLTVVEAMACVNLF